METLKKHLPAVPEGLHLSELKRIAERFEEKTYTAAANQSDYLRKISLKMLSMESQTFTQRNPGSAQAIPNQNPPSPAPGLPPQGTNPAQSSASLQPFLPSLGQSLPGVSQTSTLQNMSGMPQTAMNNGSAQGNPQAIYDAQRQLAGRQQGQQEGISQLIYHQQKMLMQNSLMQQQASQGFRQHYCHTNQMPQASLPSMSTRVQSSGAAVVQQYIGPQATNFGVPTIQQNFANAPQAGSNTETAQGNNFSSVQHGSMSDALHQGSTWPMQGAMNPQQQSSSGNILSHNSMSTMQTNANSMQANAISLQQLKRRQQEHHLMTQQMKRQQEQVLATQLHSTTDVDELKVRQGAAMKSGIYGQQAVQCGNYYQQLKQGVTFPISSSPQNYLQASSPQISHQVDQHNLLRSQLKTRNPLHPDNSLVVPSPSPLVAPSPKPVDSDKPLSNLSSLTNTGQAGHQQTLLAPQPLSIIVVNTPGTSALPLLAEFTSADGSQANVQTQVPTKSSAPVSPLDRLLKTYIFLMVKLLVVSVVIVALLIIAYNEGRHRCRV